MAGEVKVTVKNELQKIIDDLEKIRDKSSEVSEELKKSGKDTGDSLSDQVKKTENFFGKLQDTGRRVADQLRGDFKSLLSINALQGALSLSNQFKGAIGQTVSLSDAIRKLGMSFNISSKDFVSFQSRLTKGMGDIGASSEDAADVLKGLAGTSVQGQESLEGYAKVAAQLGMMSGESGKAGGIAGSLASVVTARGRNPSNMAEVQEVARAVTKVVQTTGKGASEVLSIMRETFDKMPEDLQKKLTPEAVGQLAVAASVAGPAAMKPLQRFLSLSKEERSGLEAQGFGKIFGPGGQIDLKGLKDVAKELKGRGVSSRLAAQTMGFQGEEAEGLVKLIESADRLSEALDKTSKASDDYAKRARQSMSLQEAFSANINRVKSLFSGPLSSATQGLTDVLSTASETTAGSAAVVAGGGVLAALLAGGALKGIGGGMVGGIAGTALKTKAAEAVTGQKTIPVYVTNASEISGGGMGAAAGIAGSLGKGFLGVSGPFAIAAAVVGALAPQIGKFIGEGAYSLGPESDAEKWTREQEEFRQQRGNGMTQRHEIKVKVYDEKDRELKAAKQPTRGASN